jgi:hypothetical protein
MLSAATVELNRMLLGTVPDMASTVSHGGSDVPSTVKKGAGTVAEVTATSTLPVVPEPLTYESVAGDGVATSELGGRTCKLTVTSLSALGAFARCTTKVLVVPAANEPHPAAAENEMLTAVDVAVPPDSGVAVNHAGNA